MAKLVAPLTVGALVVLALSAGGAGAKTTKVYWPGCGAFDKPAYKPKDVIITCGDGSTRIEKLKWDAWGRDEATGSGRFVVNQCEPTCSNGTVKRYSTTVRLYGARFCDRADRWEWRRIRFAFPKKHPPGYSKTNKRKLRCES